jgi:hypothetical protein
MNLNCRRASLMLRSLPDFTLHGIVRTRVLEVGNGHHRGDAFPLIKVDHRKARKTIQPDGNSHRCFLYSPRATYRRVLRSTTHSGPLVLVSCSTGAGASATAASEKLLALCDSDAACLFFCSMDCGAAGRSSCAEARADEEMAAFEAAAEAPAAESLAACRMPCILAGGSRLGAVIEEKNGFLPVRGTREGPETWEPESVGATSANQPARALMRHEASIRWRQHAA